MNLPTPPIKVTDKDANTWALILHLSQFANVVLPPAGFIAPIVIWQLKKDQYPSIDAHGRNVANWMLSAFIYLLICIPLALALIGFALAVAISIAHIAFVIIASIKAHEGIAWKYPLSIKFF